MYWYLKKGKKNGKIYKDAAFPTFHRRPRPGARRSAPAAAKKARCLAAVALPESGPSSCMDTAHVRETPPPKKQPYKGSVTSIFWYLNLFGFFLVIWVSFQIQGSGISPFFSTLSPLGWIIQIPPFHLPVTSGHPKHAQRTTSTVSLRWFSNFAAVSSRRTQIRETFRS